MSNYSDALAFCATYCSAAEHCKSEVLEKASRFELNAGEQSALIQRLEQEGFLDERRYVRAFVNDRFRFSKWGRIKIRFMLRQKGISTELVDEGIGDIPEEDYHDLLMTLLKQKKPSVRSKSSYDLRGKMLRFAAGRGFEASLASECLREMDIDEEDNEY